MITTAGRTCEDIEEYSPHSLVPWVYLMQFSAHVKSETRLSNSKGSDQLAAISCRDSRHMHVVQSIMHVVAGAGCKRIALHWELPKSNQCNSLPNTSGVGSKRRLLHLNNITRPLCIPQVKAAVPWAEYVSEHKTHLSLSASSMCRWIVKVDRHP